MNETIHAQQADLEGIIVLSDRVFRKPGQTSMGTAFSKLFAADNARNLLIVKDDETPVSLMGLLPATIRVAGCKIPLVSMGSVCTAPEFRGRQFATNLTEHALRYTYEEGATILLVSGDRSLYKRHDCMSVGQTQRFRLTEKVNQNILAPADRSAPSARVEIRPWAPDDLPNMLAIMQAEPAYFERSVDDFAELIQGAALFSCYPAEQHVWIRKVDGALDAYIVFGTLQHDNQAGGEAIEFGGNVDGVIALLQAAMREHALARLELTVPNYHRSMSEKLASLGYSFRCETLPGTIRLINLTKLWKLLQPYFATELGAESASQLQCEEVDRAAQGGAAENATFRISYAGESFTIDLRGATNLIFNGPAFVDNTPLKSALSKLFPIPFINPSNLNYV